MNTKKCDRCSKYFDLPMGLSSCICNFINHNRFHISDFSNGSVNDFDLCPECYEKLEKFLESNEEDTSNEIKEEEPSEVLVLQMEYPVSIPSIYQILDEINHQRNNKKAIVLPEGCRFITTIPKNCDIQLSNEPIEFFKPKRNLKERIRDLFNRREQNEKE